MGKWHNLKHRIQLAVAPRWFISLEKDLSRMEIGDPRVIFDVGAHLGQTTLHFRKVFQNAHIHSFEPVAENFQRLIRNIGQRDRLSPNKIALGSSIGTAFIDEGFSDLTHSISNSVEATKIQAKEEVPIETIDGYMANEQIDKIDLLKIDTEGHEIEVLKGAEVAIENNRIEAILAECDFCRQDKQHTYFPDLLEYLGDQGFAFFGLYDVIHYSNSHGIGYCNALFLNRETFPSPLSL
jgi:FkbM family methyltransferase